MFITVNKIVKKSYAIICDLDWIEHPTNTVQVIWETVFTGQKTQYQSTEGDATKGKSNNENNNL